MIKHLLSNYVKIMDRKVCFLPITGRRTEPRDCWMVMISTIADPHLSSITWILSPPQFGWTASLS